MRIDMKNKYPFDENLKEDPILQNKIPEDYHMYAIRNKHTGSYVTSYWGYGKFKFKQSKIEIKTYRSLLFANMDYSGLDLNPNDFEIVKVKVEEVEKY